MMVAGMIVILPGLPAYSDVVGPPPDTCAPGFEPSTCHGGPHCRPLECMTDADCMNGGKCVAGDYCIEEIICAGNLPEDASVDPYKRKSMVGECPNGTACAAPSTCMNLKVCVPASGSSSSAGSSASGSPPDDGGVEGTCGCTVVGGGAKEWGIGFTVLSLLGVGGWLGRRRRGAG